MIKSHSILDLYPLALAEGEGVGTAYEYYTKRLLLSSWLGGQPAPKRILVAGLPQKYGASLDFLLLAQELGGWLTIVDDRPAALARLRQAMATCQGNDLLLAAQPQLLLTGDLATLSELAPPFDLALSSEVLQRLAPREQAGYVSRLLTLAPQVALFAPNGDNNAHVQHSGLAGVPLEELELRAGEGLERGRNTAVVTSLRTGHVDMPPFPPGITRSESERAQAATGKLEAAAMWGLGIYAHLEQHLPAPWRISRSHIVYAFIRLAPAPR